MKVIIPVTDNHQGKNNIAPGFHNAEYVCIYDIENKSIEWQKTTDLSNSGNNLSEELIRNKIFTVISIQMPAMALSVFIDNGLRVFKASGDNVLDNIELFLKDLLKPYSTHESRMVSSCNGSCGTCGSTCN